MDIKNIIECKECNCWDYKNGCKKRLIPPFDYKKCKYYEDEKLKNESNTLTN
jgi:hypothetical protein